MTGAWRVRFADRGRSRFTPIITRVNRVLEQFSPRRRNRGDPRNRPPTPSRRRRRTVSDSSNNVSSTYLTHIMEQEPPETPRKDRANTVTTVPPEVIEVPNADADRIDRIKEHCQCTICLGLLENSLIFR